MKMGIQLNTWDKVAIVGAGVVIWTIGILPTAIGGGFLYHYREKMKDFVIRQSIKSKWSKFKSYFSNK